MGVKFTPKELFEAMPLKEQVEYLRENPNRAFFLANQQVVDYITNYRMDWLNLEVPPLITSGIWETKYEGEWMLYDVMTHRFYSIPEMLRVMKYGS